MSSVCPCQSSWSWRWPQRGTVGANIQQRSRVDPALLILSAAPGGPGRGSPQGKILLERHNSHLHKEKVKYHLQEGLDSMILKVSPILHIL